MPTERASLATASKTFLKRSGFQELPRASPSGNIVAPEHIKPWVPSSVSNTGIFNLVFSREIFCSSLKYRACCSGPFNSAWFARVKKPPPGPIPSIKVPSMNFLQLLNFSSTLLPSSLKYPQGILSWPIFSESVILAIRSSIRTCVGNEGS